MIGVLAGALMIATEFMTISHVKISGIASCSDLAVTDPASVRQACAISGHQQHHWALLVLGLLTIAMTVGMAIGRSRPAAVAVLALGLVTLGIALIGDSPTLHDTRGIQVVYTGAKGVTDSGYYIEIAAGVAAILAGGLGFLRKPVD